MTKRLKAYCRRVILEAARDYTSNGKRRINESTRAAFMDAMRGTDSGWWNDLIYTSEMLTMHSYYRKDIQKAVREFLWETGIDAGERCDPNGRPTFDDGSYLTYADLIASCSQGWTWDDYQGDNGRGNEKDAEAALFALRLAVEYLAGELAREYCPDL